MLYLHIGLQKKMRFGAMEVFKIIPYIMLLDSNTYLQCLYVAHVLVG